MIDYVEALGWGVTIGIIVLIVGGSILYFHHCGETKKEKAKRPAQDQVRAEAR